MVCTPRYRRNGYLLGAGTITGNLVEKQVCGQCHHRRTVFRSYGLTYVCGTTPSPPLRRRYPCLNLTLLKRYINAFRYLFTAPQVQDIGLVFGAAYTILDVRDSDGEQLIKLRNPPGDHEVLFIRELYEKCGWR